CTSIMTVYTNCFGRSTANATAAEETDFEANWNGATSATSGSVRPRRVLQRLAGRYYRLSATAFATKFFGKYALIHRFTRAHGWRSFKRVSYKTFRALSDQVRVSQVRFRAKIRRGLRIRAF